MSRYQANLRIVDVSAELRKTTDLKEFMGKDLTIPDYRFEIDTPTGGTVTFSQDTTADLVMLYVLRNGWDPKGVLKSMEWPDRD